MDAFAVGQEFFVGECKQYLDVNQTHLSTPAVTEAVASFWMNYSTIKPTSQRFASCLY